MRRRGAALLLALCAALVIGVQGAAAVGLWTLTVSPQTATVGTGTTFSLTATSLDPDLGIKCVIMQVPSAISPGDTWVTGSSTTASWTALRSGQQVTVVIALGDGNQKMTAGGWLSIAVNGVPTASGAYAFTGVAYSNHGCSEDARVLAAPPVVVISGPVIVEPLPTPVPTPTPAPTPPPTPKPTPTPLLTLPTLPPLLPPVGADPTPRPTAQPRASATPTPTALPSEPPAPTGTAATSSPTPSAAVGAAPPAPPAGPSLPPSAADRASQVLAVGRVEPAGPDAVEVSLGPLGVIDSLEVWAIPSAVISGPGLLVIVWVVAQASVAAAWAPAVRRLRGGPEPTWRGSREAAS